jgi:hypothetical protein
MIHFLKNRSEKQGTAEGIIHASEFSVFFGKCAQDPAIIQILSDLYDCPDNWDYTTLARGQEKLEKVCITMLGGSTHDWFRTSLPEDALGGGFFSRLICVAREESGKRTPFPEDTVTPELMRKRANCVEDLKSIHQMCGEFSWDQDAKVLYADWYMNYFVTAGIPAVMRGYIGRKGDLLIKLAMLASASHSSNRVISTRDFQFALACLNENEQFLPTLVRTLGTTEEGKRSNRVLEIIKKQGTVSHSVLLQNVSHQMSAQDVKLVIDSLQESGMVRKVITTGKKGIYYEYLGKDKRAS